MVLILKLFLYQVFLNRGILTLKKPEKIWDLSNLVPICGMFLNRGVLKWGSTVVPCWSSEVKTIHDSVWQKISNFPVHARCILINKVAAVVLSQ